ncbi:GAF domain-containing protein [Pontibacter arcticus]|uniref:GAF domain-containing protein n=1 Tax=Pontibacter arcticus TaxID=2080288 RepID=A0A364RF59_9BACT|nr:GAF domain-containing protein [Pontibacter arcticus]RAU82912.1 GAF domain-containing protein [Pontibacter arcticus]
MNYFINTNIIPENDSGRIAKLQSLHVLNTHEENGTFKHIAAMASHMFDVPIALVNFVDKDFVITKAQIGLDNNPVIDRGISLCSLAILRSDVTVFENAREEPCLLSNPMVAGGFGLQFYAAAPLVTKDGYNIGAVCIVDKKPRTFSEADQKMLENLATIVMDDIEK